MIDVTVVKEKLQQYLLNQIELLGESNPAIKLVKPFAKRAIASHMNSFDKFFDAISVDGKIDVEGILTEEIEAIKSIPNYDFTLPYFGDGNISSGNITLSLPFINKGVVFNESDLESFKQLLIQ